MNQLPLFDGYSPKSSDPDPPTLTFLTMAKLALRTWPFIRPMLAHLLLLLGLAGIGLIAAMAGAFVGVDLFTNKVLIGEKLQPLQASILLLDDEYVTSDPQQLGKTFESDTKPKDELETESTPELTEQLTPAQRRTVRNRLIIWGIIGGILGTLLGLGGWYYTTWIWQSVNQNLRVAMVERAESLSLRYHDEARVGDAIFRVYQDSSMIVNLIESGILSPLMTVYGLLVAFTIVIAFDPLIAGFVLIAAVPFALLLIKSTRRIRRRALANRTANSNLTSHVQESFTAVKVIKANGSEPLIHRKFIQDSKRALDAAYHLRLDMVLLSLAVAFLGGLLLVGSEYLIARWVIFERETLLGAMVAGLIGFAIWNTGAFQTAQDRLSSLSGSASYLLDIWMRIQDLFIALRRAFELLDAPIEVEESAHPEAYPNPIESVAWNQVEFAYEKDGRSVLSELTLQAHVGTVTAIVGLTGSGKSTMMSLLLRLFDPARGDVRINDKDIRQLKLDDVRRNCAIALQKNVLFNDTVANNIAFGARQINRGAIEQAAKIAEADEFIQELEKGYDTELGERGGKLSAGQRQRLSIARAVVRDTAILILDEPTASLDARTEQRVLQNLAAWGKGKVILLITHRLSTIQNADHIALLEGGRIVESGTHKALLAQAGKYATFVRTELESSSDDIVTADEHDA